MNQLIALKAELENHEVEVKVEDSLIIFSSADQSISYLISDEVFDFEHKRTSSIIPLDYLKREPIKTASVILSKLQKNTTVFARNCTVKKIDRKAAGLFLDNYHLMNSTQSAFNLGLYSKDELIALASFSKGRKMNRLASDRRSFELIRFCCKSAITVTGGLTKLLKNFCEEKQAGDIMTYVDKQWSDGSSFVKAGFKKHSETEPNFFLIDRESYERKSIGKDENFDKKKFYRTQNAGNIKLIYTPGKI